MKHYIRLGLCVVVGALQFACASDKDDGQGNGNITGDGDYVSANPSNTSGATRGGGVNAGSGGATTGAPSADSGGEAERAIEEADIVKLDDHRLYALSQYGGLSVIDATSADSLKLLGRFKSDAMPFEMYLRGSVVLGLFNDCGNYEYDEATATWSWAQSSRVLALDVSDPAHIEELATFRIPGAISDSRIVGDVLYVVGYESGSCWGCAQGEPGTTIISLDVSDPLQVTKVDELRYLDMTNEWGGWKKSVTVTDERMYVGGVEYWGSGALGSTIDVIDISDPNGDLVPNGRVEAEGQISSRWQMDEYAGVLRVISQNPTWDSTRPPVVQTWQVNSNNTLSALGRTELTLPVATEQLQSARFDGPRGYAITFQQTDPLFTLDLSDPANPKQVGELEMPGFLYHMEPRGNRMLGLGFDQNNPEGAMTVSLFDVTDMAAPIMLDRVNFGGDWAYVAEDQDRIHKAFNVLDELGTILVPFSGYSYTNPDGCGSYMSGVQLIDWANDELVLRGLAPSVGQARRGFFLDERLFTVSDERVQTFDVADRDQPVQKSSLTLLSNVMQSAIIGEYVARLNSDWWTSAPRLEVTTLADAENAVPLGAIELAPSIQASEGKCSWSGWYARKLFANGQYAYVLYDGQTYFDGYYVQQTKVAVVDVSEPTNPTLVATHALPANPASSDGYTYYSYGSYYGGNLAPSGSDVVQIGSTLAQLRYKATYNSDYTKTTVTNYVDIIDLSDPASPRSQTLEVPTGLGTTSLLASGNVVALSHYAAADTTGANVRFYLDRIDVSDPAAPALLPKVNIPGSLLAYDGPSDGAITVDYHAVTEAVVNSNECYSRFGYSATFTPLVQDRYDGAGTCRSIKQSVHLVRLLPAMAGIQGSYALGAGEYVSMSATGDDRTFITLNGYWGYYGYAVGGVADCYDCGYYGGFTAVSMPLLTVGGLSSGTFAAGRLDVPGGDYWSASSLVATGQRALVSSGWRGQLSVIDAADAAAPQLVKSVDIHGYVSDLDVAGDTALASLGMDGAQLIDLGN